ncbi:MoaD/ThiS family protein [Siphonobacter aquaeclarae]|jgi:molybdopterin converting factor subunit 1|uniref:Molybdopterin synthase sulfur carrier subunit n=1 Tax=Siphonobacter aquaeclarae TaxID=563176 RepID=A0A1G9WBB9_9BACT|nr:MoaD/ThiS family protein [Siphonobacter aquaeclarae]MBO9640863.1 MoaD/ThiS family protein [Siphonobacter aquaeclarae]SDM81583.1 molybdopterin synthase sulfur carrier subunit [Siphonobacter aquaeclarae]
MELTVHLFGITRDITRKSRHTVVLEEGSSVQDLLRRFYTEYPELEGLKSLVVAVNDEYAEPTQVLNIRDEVALIPPVSGG